MFRSWIQLTFGQNANVKSFLKGLFGTFQHTLEGLHVIFIGLSMVVGLHIDRNESAGLKEEFGDGIGFQLFPLKLKNVMQSDKKMVHESVQDRNAMIPGTIEVLT